MSRYTEHINPQLTPQSHPLPGSNQVANNAGGFAFPVDDWTRLARWLVLGSEGPTYYATERKLTLENVEVVKRCLALDGPRTVVVIAECSSSGRAPKNDAALLALAIASKSADPRTRRAAYEALPSVARIGTHLFHFAQYRKALGWGGGAGLLRALARWYDGKPVVALAHQVIKYQQRDGWAHRDLFRLAKIGAGVKGTRGDLYGYIVRGWPSVGEQPHSDLDLGQVWAFERAKTATTVAEIVVLINTYGLPRECVPTQWLNEPAVWEALLVRMKPEAMIRSLGKMTHVGLLKPMAQAVKLVVDRLHDAEAIRRARLHPIKVLAALLQYGKGAGERGSLTWSPSPAIVDALNDAFYLAFGAVEPSGKRTLLALDVSGSMDTGECAGIPGLSPRMGSSAMAMVTAAVEPAHHFVGFTSGATRSRWSTTHGLGTGLTELAISARKRLDDVAEYTRALPMGGTDCSLPMVWALERKLEVDTFVIYTDNETWAGNVHPPIALRNYRQGMGIPAKLIVVSMVANEFSIADPADGGMLDVVGFDTAAPILMADFARG